jgi:hypothetical protein
MESSRMRKDVCLSAFLFMLFPTVALSSHVSETAPLSPADNSLGGDPSQFDRKIEAATLDHDVAFFAAVLAPDVRFSHGTGLVWNKERWLTGIAHGQSIERSLTSVEVEPHGDVVETTGHIHVKSDREIHLSSGPTREYDVWYVRVYAQRHGQWLLLSNRTVREQASAPSQ